MSPLHDDAAPGKLPPHAGGVSAAEQELFGGRLRYNQAYVHHEGALTRMTFGRIASALPRMVAVVLRAGWAVTRGPLPEQV